MAEKGVTNHSNWLSQISTFIFLLFLYGKSLAAPEPVLTSLSAPSEITIGEWAEVSISIINDGNNVASDGYITASFPAFTSSSDSEFVVNNGSSSTPEPYQAGIDDIWYQASYQKKADYAALEFQQAPYGINATRTLSFRVRPQETGTFRIYWRSHLIIDDDYSNPYALPSSSSRTDHAGWPVNTISISVVEIEPPEPEIKSVTFPSQIDLGDSASIEVRVDNNGGDSPEGGITISFPDFNTNGDSAYITNNGSSSGSGESLLIRETGEQIYNNDCQQFSASYALAEFFDTDWENEEDNYLRIQVEPKKDGAFTFYVRSAISTEGEGCDGWVNEPGSSSSSDQQGWNVNSYTINVVTPVPQPNINSITLNGSSSESITIEGGEDVLVSVAGINNGRAATSDGELQIAFPLLTTSDASNYVSVGDTWPDDFEYGLRAKDHSEHGQWYDSCTENGDGQVDAQYLLAYGVDTNWQENELNTAEFRFQPPGPGEYPIYIKLGMHDAVNDEWLIDPENSEANLVDAQCENVILRTVIVEAPESPSPKITEVLLNGSNVDNININAGQEVVVRLSGRNEGRGATTDGELQIAFPTLTTSHAGNYVSVGDTWPDDFEYGFRAKDHSEHSQWYDSCTENGDGQVDAQYLLAYGVDANWQENELNTAEFRFQPPGPGEYPIYIKLGMHDAVNDSWLIDPSVEASDQQDQQCERVLLKTITVNEPAQPELTNIKINDSNADSISVTSSQIVTIELTGINTGSSPSDDGELQIAFPFLTSATAGESVAAASGWPDDLIFDFRANGHSEKGLWYDSCVNNGTGQVEAQYLLAFGVGTNWLVGESRTAKFRFHAPLEPGSYPIYVKFAMNMQGDDWAFYPGSNSGDQQDAQCEWVEVKTLVVNSAAPSVPDFIENVVVDYSQNQAMNLDLHLDSESSSYTVSLFLEGNPDPVKVWDNVNNGEQNLTLSTTELESIVNGSGTYQFVLVVSNGIQNQSVPFSIRVIDEEDIPDTGGINVPPSNDGDPQDSDAIRDTNANNPENTASVEDPVNVAYGNYYLNKCLFKVPAIGSDLNFCLYYDTLVANEDSVVGHGWRHNWDIKIIELDPNRVAYQTQSGNRLHFKRDDEDTDESDGIDYLPTLGASKDTLTKHPDGSYWLITEDNQTFGFSSVLDSPDFKLTSWVNEFGRGHNFTYGSSGLTMISTNWSGQAIRFTYTNGRLTRVYASRATSVEAIGGQVWNLEYSSGGDLQKLIDPMNFEHAFTYNNHLMVSATDPAGKTYVTNEYDEQQRIIKQWDGEGSLSEFSYDWGDDYFITYVTNRSEKTESFTHDSNRRLTKHINPLGGETSYTWDQHNNITSITDPNGNTTLLEYFEDTQWVKQKTLPIYCGEELCQESWTYFENGTTKTYTNQLGHTTNYDRHSNGLAKSKTTINGTWTYTYTDKWLLETVTDPKANVISTGYNAYGDSTTKTDAKNNIWSWIRDDMGRVLTKSDPLNNTYTWAYNTNGWLTSLTDAESNIISWEYFDNGKVKALVDPANIRFEVEYDQNDRVVSVTNAATGDKISREWTKNDQLKSETLPGGRTTQWEHDDNDRVIAAIDAANRRTEFEWDANSNKTAEIDPAGNRTEYLFDNANRNIAIRNGEGELHSFYFDGLNRVIKEVDGENRTVNETIYDDISRTVTEKDSLGNETVSHFDELGNRTRKVDPLEHETNYEYDANYRLIKTIDALNGISEQQFDAAGRLERVIDPKGGGTSFVRDKNGRVTEEHDVLGNVIYKNYEPRGNLSSLTNGRGQEISITYRDDGLIDTIDRDGKNIQHVYNGALDLIEKTDGNISVKYGRDELGRMTSRTDPNNRTISWSYNAASLVEQLMYSTGETVDYAFDKALRLTKVTDNDSGLETSYSWDKGGLLSSISKPDGSVTALEYDEALRLIKQEATSGQKTIASYHYELDARGQRTSATVLQPLAPVLPTEEMNFEYNDASQQVSLNGVEQSFDADGNQTIAWFNGGKKGYGYNSLNQLTHLSRFSEEGLQIYETQYWYDFDGHRYKTTLNGSMQYVINTNSPLSQVIEEWDNSGNQTRYVYGIGLISRVENSGENYRVYHFDTRGSTIALTDQQGQVTDKYSYGPFGKLLAESPDNSIRNPFKYNGRDGVITEQNGLYYMRMRFFNPESKRFLNRDVLLGSIENGQTLNRYAYVVGDPISLIDPLGMSGQKDSSSWLDNVQTGVDVAGVGADVFFGAGAFFDGANALIYLARGDFTNAGLSTFAMLPFIGNAATGAKYAKKTDELLELAQVAKRYDIAVDGRKRCDDCAKALITKAEDLGLERKKIVVESPSKYFIYSETASKLPGSPAVSDTGFHVGVEVNGVVFDNIHINGKIKDDWINDFDAVGGITWRYE